MFRSRHIYILFGFVKSADFKIYDVSRHYYIMEISLHLFFEF